VLVVDDTAWNQELARAVLEHHGVRVEVTASAAEALALFVQHRYDVVLMDVHMPGMNGLEVTTRLRQHPDPDRAATPVPALTADAFLAQHASYWAAGMSDVLAKPLTEAELVAKLVALGRVDNQSSQMKVAAH
jgi:CheY-like chemotaxis protein